jgi:RNA polymerase sigma-70 factor, ECF subfamily
LHPSAVSAILWVVSYESIADDTLIVEVARGDRVALSHLYDRYVGVMSALALRILGNERDTEDLIHDVFVEVWQRAGDFDPSRGSVKTWLLVRVRSRCLDRKKSPSVKRRRAMPDDDDVVGVDARDHAEVALDGQRLREALEMLPADQRGVLVLGYFEGLSSSEIAARLDIPIGTVKSRVSAAMMKLRDRLGARAGHGGP